MNKEKIDRINSLAKKQKNEGLSDQEKQEQAILRREYIESYKKNLIAQLDNTYILENDGTKRKVKPKDETSSD